MTVNFSFCLIFQFISKDESVDNANHGKNIEGMLRIRTQTRAMKMEDADEFTEPWSSFSYLKWSHWLAG